jgi:hypothetical protein
MMEQKYNLSARKTINVYKLTCILVLLFVAAGMASSCKNPNSDYEREKVYLDSLSSMLQATQVALNVDEAKLKDRMGIIDTWYIKLNDTAHDVAQKMRVDFNGFKSVYQRYINNFFIYQASADLLQKQYKGLEEKVKNREISRSDFKAQYTTLKKDLEQTLEGAAGIAKPVYDLEFSWKRYEKVMSEMRGRNYR